MEGNLELIWMAIMVIWKAWDEYGGSGVGEESLGLGRRV